MPAEFDRDARLAAEIEQRSRSFGDWAPQYERYRPSYPDALFDHISARLQLPARAQVADLGAGTGKAARAMARRGWHVVAIEPGESMLRVLRAQAVAEGLDIETRLAQAEQTGLPDTSVDLVTAAQAFHWFDTDRAVPEMARIVRPGGGVAAFWNSRAEDRSPFLAAYIELLGHYVPEEHIDRHNPDDVAHTREQLSVGGWFAVDERVQLTHTVQMTHDDFLGLVFTASYVRMFAQGGAEERLRSDLRTLLTAHGPDGRVDVLYDVHVYIGQRRSG
jgi:SAM-dependent methyltransferase